MTIIINLLYLSADFYNGKAKRRKSKCQMIDKYKKWDRREYIASHLGECNVVLNDSPSLSFFRTPIPRGLGFYLY